MLPRPRLIIVAIFVVLAIISTVTALVSVAPGADIAAGRRKAEACVPCHGAAGNAITPGTPSLAGMPPFYTHWQLIMYRDGRRRDAQMSPFAINLTDADMADLAAYYAAQLPRVRPVEIDTTRAAAGRPLAQSFHCGSCHGPQLMGQNQVARLAGQDFDYLLKRLRGYKAKTTSDLDGMMTMVAQSLSEEDIQNLVHFMAGAAPTPASAGGDGR
ncbi:MAG TPA: c-type cytochrome [Methylomirabilota bacterium]|jgi:cytochrome c553